MNRNVTNSPSGVESNFYYGYIIIIISSLMMAIVWGTHFAFGVFFKEFVEEFGWTRAVTSVPFSLAFITSGLMSVFMGGLTDRIGPRKVIILSGFVLGLGFFLMSRVTNAWQLFLFYGVIIGIGLSGTFVPLASTGARWFFKRRNVMTGIIVSGSGLGQLLMPLLSGWVKFF